MSFSVFALLLYLLPTICGLNVYQSTVSLIESKSLVSGLHFQTTAMTTIHSNSLTVCIRFNFKRLGLGNEARIFAFDWPGSSKDFLYMYARYPQTWMSLGHYEDPTAFGGYIISENYNYNVWATNRWHHLCLSFEEKATKIILVKVRKPRFVIASICLKHLEILDRLCICVSVLDDQSFSSPPSVVSCKTTTGK